MANIYNRYKNTPKIKILNDSYREFFDSKKINQILCNTTQGFKDIATAQNLTYTSHIWNRNDTFHSLSQKYYENPRYWFVIALTNNKPTEFLMQDAEELKIYFPLVDVLGFYGIL